MMAVGSRLPHLPTYLIFPVLFWVLPEQYNTTKSSWMADYCKEKEEEPAPQPPAPPPWLGSSVDPSNLGSSKFGS